MNSFRTMFPIFGVLAVLAGCSAESSTNGSVDSASNAQSKSTLTKDERAPERHKGFHARMHGGPDFLLFAALREDIKLTPEQRATIEGLVAQNKPKEPSEKARPEVRDPARITALAAGIRAGKVDAALLKTTHEGHEAAMKERMAVNASALATLHKTLTKEQRVALVDGMAANRAKHEGKEHKFGRPGFEGAERHPAMADGRAHTPMDGLLEGLDLTSAQQETIRTKTTAVAAPTDADREAMKTKFEAMKKDREAKLQSFKNDDFDATSFAAPPANADADGHKQSHAARMAEQLSIVVSVLDAAQREKLAQKIEQGPPARPQGHMGRPAR